ncbi:hypothetical protein KGO95_01695 [Patescibacteria group bacterium]|nr:hypothetical protein [Patescibacteria group bacterium]
MLKDHNHDLIKQLSVSSSSLWRMEEYRKNAKGCPHCEKLWGEVEKLQEKISALLTDEVTRHVKEGKFE